MGHKTTQACGREEGGGGTKKCRSELKGLSHRVPEARNAFGFCGLSEELPRQQGGGGGGKDAGNSAVKSAFPVYHGGHFSLHPHAHTHRDTQGRVTAKMPPDVALCGKVAASFNAKQLNWILAGRSPVAALPVCVCVCLGGGGWPANGSHI